jgi:hypothetical protein
MIDFDLRQTLEDVVRDARAEECNEGLRLSTRLDTAIPAGVRGDQAHLRSLLLLLVGRAASVTTTGEIRVRASLDERRGDRLSVRFEVSDEGEALGDEQLADERIFDIDAGDPNLALWRQVAPLVAHDMGITSRVDGGNTYWFTAALDIAGAPFFTEPS